MKRGLLLIFLLLQFIACVKVPEQVQESLELAGKNKRELKKVLRYYNRNDKDSLKFRAACFLIENMRWHSSYGEVKFIDPQLGVLCHQLDSLYNEIYQVKGKDSLGRVFPIFRKKYKWMGDSIRKCKFQPSIIEPVVVNDLKVFDSKFLISHIDNAFRQWEISPFAKRLNFNEFCEYILPYRSLEGYPCNYSGERLQQIYGKYVCYNPEGNLIEHVKRYNRAVTTFRSVLGRKPQKDIGIYNLYFQGHECIDIANYGCAVLRACGVPMMIEFCDAFRDFAGRHFYCIIPDSTGKWITFNPESSLPGAGSWVYSVPMNLYREYYGAQKDSPYFLKAEGEYLPPLFENPCLKEITAERAKVFSVTLPFAEETGNHLAYLAAFQARREIAPVTWGVIDTVRRQVTFTNVMPRRLYFPIYYEGEELQAFAHPFYVEKDTLAPEGYVLHSFASDTTNGQHLLLTRKFPRKPNMIRVAANLVGATFKGANKPDFSDARLLYTITEAPQPYFQEYKLKRPGAYRFYRFTAPDKHPQANVSMLEFLTDRKYGYENVLPPTRVDIVSPEDTLKGKEDGQWVKLLDASSWDKMKWKAEYDGNMQTAPSVYRIVNLELKEPQVVERIRFAPKNADNGIRAGDEYELFYWGKDGWISCGRKKARYEYLEYENVPINNIFWLRNYSTGKEELPFIIKDGKQLFFYYDIAK